MHRLGLAALAIIAVWLPAALADITGSATVVDGDTLNIADTPIRLHGIVNPPFYVPLADSVSGTGGRMFRA